MKLEKILKHTAIIVVGTIVGYKAYELAHQVYIEHKNQKYLNKIRGGGL